jgi:calcium-dependent protein kinase
MRLLSASGHPNILRLHELFIGNMNFYIVMELALGGSLLGVMKRRETLFDRREIRCIMRQLLDG